MKSIYIGVDVGSVSTNVVAIDKDVNVLFKTYIRTNGQPIDSVKEGIRQLKESLGDVEVLGVGTTGSGRQLAGAILGADVIKKRNHSTCDSHNPFCSKC